MDKDTKKVIGAKYPTKEAQIIIDHCKNRNITPSTLVRVAISEYLSKTAAVAEVPAIMTQDLAELMTNRISALRTQGKCFQTCYTKANLKDPKAPWEPEDCARLLAKNVFYCRIYDEVFCKPAPPDSSQVPNRKARQL